MSTTAPNMLGQALLYAGAGINVFPVDADKKPLTGLGGFHHATTDRGQIESWWHTWPDAGIATPDYDVVDVDAYKPGGREDWEKIRPLIPSDTPRQKTPRGGVQFFFAAGSLNGRKFADTIDLRYAGRNYVLLPPSRFAEHGRYAWVTSVLERKPKPAPDFPNSASRSTPAPPIADKIPHGRQHYELVSLAGSMRRRGMNADEIFAALWQVNVNRCERPGPEENIRQIAESVERYEPEAKPTPQDTDTPANEEADEQPIVFVTLREFLEMEFPPSESLVGQARGGTNLLPRHGWLLPWGPEGCAKTSIVADLIAHGAAGLDWLGYEIAAPIRFVVVVNEGVPGALQDKLAQKVELWDGEQDALLDRIAVYASPWGAFTLRNERMLWHLREYADEFEADYIALDPLHTVGTTGAGAPAETEEFKHRLRELGLWESVGVVTAHHSNKAGMVSGDWGRHPDTLIRLEKDGDRPASKWTLQKARPADPDELGKLRFLEWETERLGYRWVERSPEAVGDENRNAVMAAVRDGKHAVADVAAAVELSERTVKRHLHALEERGLLTLGAGDKGKLCVVSVDNGSDESDE